MKSQRMLQRAARRPGNTPAVVILNSVLTRQGYKKKVFFNGGGTWHVSLYRWRGEETLIMT